MGDWLAARARWQSDPRGACLFCACPPDTMRTLPPQGLFPYQLRWVTDPSQFKIWLASRQIGKTHAAAFEVVNHALEHPSAQWLILSGCERQALEFMLRIQDHFRAWSDARTDDDPPAPTLRKKEITLANGSRILALPANPNTVRGYSANLVLDEFAFHQDSEAIWRALLPTVTSRLHGPLKLRVLSTPHGRDNAFHRLWLAASAPAEPGRLPWSAHRTTIHDAQADGFQVDLEGLRRQLDDPIGWAQEYEGEFLDTASVLLPLEFLTAAETPGLPTDWPWTGDDAETGPAEPIWVGADLGRTQHPTVVYALGREGRLWSTRGIAVHQGMTWEDQQAWFQALLRRSRPQVQRLCVDSAGAGDNLAETLRRHARPGQGECCGFTSVVRSQLFVRLHQMFRDHLVRIPRCAILREELHALRQLPSRHGEVRIEIPEIKRTHCDRAVALALALHATLHQPGSFKTAAYR